MLHISGGVILGFFGIVLIIFLIGIILDLLGSVSKSTINFIEEIDKNPEHSEISKKYWDEFIEMKKRK
jgi:hypothetical protein